MTLGLFQSGFQPMPSTNSLTPCTQRICLGERGHSCSRTASQHVFLSKRYNCKWNKPCEKYYDTQQQLKNITRHSQHTKSCCIRSRLDISAYALPNFAYISLRSRRFSRDILDEHDGLVLVEVSLRWETLTGIPWIPSTKMGSSHDQDIKAFDQWNHRSTPRDVFVFDSEAPARAEPCSNRLELAQIWLCLRSSHIECSSSQLGLAQAGSSQQIFSLVSRAVVCFGAT